MVSRRDGWPAASHISPITWAPSVRSTVRHEARRPRTKRGRRRRHELLSSFDRHLHGESCLEAIMRKYDAIIVGARCAGSPTAMLLARKGYKVLVVDRAAFPSDTISTHMIHGPGVAALRRWGLLDQVVATGWSSRSEEHTAELQAPLQILCPLLL